MRPRHIAYIIWTVIALLGVVCIVVPNNGWHIGKWNLRFPTLTEALDIQTVDSLQLTVDSLQLTNDSLQFTVDS